MLSRHTCLRRPGILVLVNDSDWELLVCAVYSFSKVGVQLRHARLKPYTYTSNLPLQDGLDYELSANDNVVFISTLHGG